MKQFAYKIEALDEWGGSCTEIVHAVTEDAAEDKFKFCHAAESLEITSITFMGV